MVRGTDLWVYNFEFFGVSIFNQVASIFHLGGGEIKKNLSAYLFLTLAQYLADN